MVTLKFFATLRDLIGRKEIRVEADKVEDALIKASKLTNVDLIKELIDENRNPKKAVIILVNGRNIVHLEGIDTSLNNGDTVSIFPPVGGG